MIKFWGTEEKSIKGNATMDVCSYIDDCVIFTIIDESSTLVAGDEKSDFLTYVLSGHNDAMSIPRLFELSQHSEAGHHCFPDGAFVQEHETRFPTKQWMEISIEGPLTTFTIGEFPAGHHHKDGYSYSYTMPTKDFQEMAAKIMDLHVAVYNV